MAGLNLTLANAVLKDDYKGPLRKQINDATKALAQFEKNHEDIVGAQAVIPCHVGRNTGVGSRKEGEVMPAAGNQRTVQATVPVRSHYGRIRFTKQVITRMESDRGAFVRAIKLETDGLKSDATRDQSRQVWNPTSDGALATCGTTSASTTVQLATTTPEQRLLDIREGMRLDIGTASNPQSIASDRLVSSVDLTNKTVTVDGAAVTTTSAAFLFRQGAGGTSTDQRELTPVPYMVKDTGSLQGIDPATEPIWAALVDDNGSVTTPLSENMVEKIVQRSENRSGKMVDSLWCEDGVYRFAANMLKARQRIVNTLELKGGHKAIDFQFGADSLPLARDRDAPTATIYGLNHESIVEYVDQDWTWEDEDGSGVLRLSSDSTHSFEGIFYKFSELGCVQRNANFKIGYLEEA